MREYVIRVRHAQDGGYHATIRELAPHARDVRTFIGPEGHGTANTEPAAMLAAITDLRLPPYRPERRRSQYAC